MRTLQIIISYNVQIMFLQFGIHKNQKEVISAKEYHLKNHNLRHYCNYLSSITGKYRFCLVYTNMVCQLDITYRESYNAKIYKQNISLTSCIERNKKNSNLSNRAV